MVNIKKATVIKFFISKIIYLYDGLEFNRIELVEAESMKKALSDMKNRIAEGYYFHNNCMLDYELVNLQVVEVEKATYENLKNTRLI